jgi:DNA repair protein RecN (Recombination protein N)
LHLLILLISRFGLWFLVFGLCHLPVAICHLNFGFTSGIWNLEFGIISMLSLLHIKNVALIDDVRVEFDKGLNLLTGETGSGKSIIVDSLNLLIGGRGSADFVKEGAEQAFIEGLFVLRNNPELIEELREAGFETENAIEPIELIIRRELSASGRNRVFINNQLATQSFLKKIGHYLVDIHGQGEQQTLFDPAAHLDILDEYAGVMHQREDLKELHGYWTSIERELKELRVDEDQKLQLADILRFQIDEIRRARLVTDEDKQLEDERRRLNNVEKLSTLSDEAFALIYEDEESVISRLGQASRKVEELAEYESEFKSYLEGLSSAKALLEDLSLTLRGFRDDLEFSPERLEEIENRLAEIARLKRKYGGSIETAFEHLTQAEDRLSGIEDADTREAELLVKAAKARADYLRLARQLHKKRVSVISKFESEVEAELKAVALDRARFEVHINAPSETDLSDENTNTALTPRGFDRVEFYFSANVGESVRPLSKVASGGEASRLMLVLKTITTPSEFPRTAVFDEIDTGIGGRVSEAVGRKLKLLSNNHQVLCVTHQPQIASLADHHFLVQKEMTEGRTKVNLTKLDRRARVEEIARMLTGERITETARKHAKELLKAGS